MVSVGNHESECHSPACLLHHKEYGLPLSNFSAYNARWNMPSAASGGAANMWYSFNFGPVHFVSLNSETDFPTAEERNTGDSHDKGLPAGHFGRTGEYMAWLEADLKQAAADRGSRPWIIAGGHRPCCGDIPGAQALFAKYGVAMYFAGHTHSYIRSKPTYGNGTSSVGGVLTGPGATTTFDPAAAATTYIVAGGAGCDEMAYVGDGDERGPPWANPERDCDSDGVCIRRRPGAAVPVASGDPEVAVTSGRLASGVLRVLSPSELEWTLYASTDGSVIDTVKVVQ